MPLHGDAEAACPATGETIFLVFAASALGNEPQINQGLTLGTVDVIYTGQAFAARTYPPLAIGGAPFMFRDFDHWKKYSQSDLLKDLMEGYYKKGGNKPLAVTYYGVRHTTANKPIVKPEDLQGLKLRQRCQDYLAQVRGGEIAGIVTADDFGLSPEVNEARQERERMINEATKQANQEIPKARVAST